MKRTKQQLLQEFTEMRDLEAKARDLYAGVAQDPQVTSDIVRRVFQSISEDEQRHVQFVERLLQIVKNNM